MTILYLLDLIGTFVFAISGALSARHKNLDIFGASVVGFVTAVGGGTLRDVLIGSTPVGWMLDLNYLYLVIFGVSLSFFFNRLFEKIRRTMFLFDTIGIAVFTLLGLEKTLSYGLHPIIAVMMGTVSAVFGGAIRDILTNEIPMIFRKEIYATVCIGGGFLYLGLHWLPLSEAVATVITVIFIIATRLIVIKKNLYLPQLKKHS